MHIISVKYLINSEIGISSSKGTKLYKKIKNYLDKNEDFLLDFSEMKVCAPPFLTFSIGRLLLDVKKAEVIKIIDNAINLDPIARETVIGMIEDYQKNSDISPEKLLVNYKKVTKIFADGSWRDGMED